MVGPRAQMAADQWCRHQVSGGGSHWGGGGPRGPAGHLAHALAAVWLC